MNKLTTQLETNSNETECNCFAQTFLNMPNASEYLKRHNSWCLVNAPNAPKPKELK